MAKKRPYNQQFKLLILLILFFASHRSSDADGLFSSFAKRNLLIKPKNLVKGFFKSFKPFQDFPNFQQEPITQDDLLMQQAFNSPPRLLPLDGNSAPPISEYLVSNFARLNPSKLKQIVGNQLTAAPMTNHFRTDQMSLSESVPHSNLFYPSSYPPNLLPGSAPINHNLMFDQSQKVQTAAQPENEGDYPAPSQMVNSYRSSKEQSSGGTSLSIGAAPGGGIGLKLGKFQMTFRKGNDGPQINLGTHDESTDDQDAENSYVSMSRARDKKKGMNIKLGKGVQFSIGGNNEDGEEGMRAGGSNNVRNVISFDPSKLKERILPRKSSNLMSSASENNYDESPGIQMPAITIGGSGNGRPAITIGGGGNDDEQGGNYAAARPQITIGGGDSGYSENNGGGGNGGGGQSGGDHWNDHWNDHKRPRIYMKMPDMPQTYIEKNMKLPPIKLKLHASPRVKITTGTKDPLEKEKIEEDPDMEDIFRPPEPFNLTTPEKEKNDTSKDTGSNNGSGGGMNGNDQNNNGFNNNGKFNPNSNNMQNPYSNPMYQQQQIQNNPPEQINFVSKYDEQRYEQKYEHNYNNYHSYQSDYSYQNSQQNPRRENIKGAASNDLPVYNDQGGYQIRQPPPNYNTYHIDNGNNNFNRNNYNENRYQQPIQSGPPMIQNNYQPPPNNYQQQPQPPANYGPQPQAPANYGPQPQAPANYGPPQLPNQYNQPPAPFNGGPYNGPPSGHHYNGNRRPYGEKTKEQIEEENAIYLKSKDEFAEDRPQIILDMRPKISISHVNATHPEEKKDPRHKNPFFKMLMNPEFVNHTTPGPEFDDDFNAPGYHKNYPNHYDFNKYKNFKPGKYGINYPKRTTTPRPVIDKDKRKSLTTTENPDAEDADYEDSTTTQATTTTTSGGSSAEDMDSTSTKQSTRDPDDELENTTTGSTRKPDESSTKKDDDDDDDDEDTKLLNKLTTTGRPGASTTTEEASTESSGPTSSTTEDSLMKKLTTSKPGKKATTSTTLSPDEYEDYDFGFIQGRGNGTVGQGKRRRKRPRTTTKAPSADLDDPTTTESSDEPSTAKSSEDDDDEKASNEKLVKDAKKKEEAKPKSEPKEDYFTQMMNMLRSEKNPKKEPSTTSVVSTEASAVKTTTESDDDDEEETTLSTTQNPSKIKGRNQTDRSEALQFTTPTTEQSTSSSVLSPKRSKAARKATKPDKIAGSNTLSETDDETEVTTITDKSMLLNLLRMVNDNMEIMKRMHASTSSTPCPPSSSTSSSTSVTAASSRSSESVSSTTEKSESDEKDELDEDDEKKSDTTVNDNELESSSKPSSSSSLASTSGSTSGSSLSTTEEEPSSTTEENDDDEQTTTEESITSKSSTKKSEEDKDEESTTSKGTTKKIDEDKDEDDDEDSSEKDTSSTTTSAPTSPSTASSTTTTTTTTESPKSTVEIQQTTSEEVKSTGVTRAKKFGMRKTSITKGTKTVSEKNTRTTSFFEMKSEKMVIATSTQSSFLIDDLKEDDLDSSSGKKEQSSTTSKPAIGWTTANEQRTENEGKVSIDTSDLDDELGGSSKANSTLSLFDNSDSSNIEQTKQSNEPLSSEPIIVVLLPNEESKLDS